MRADLVLFPFLFIACSDPPTPHTPHSGEVAANSASEARLNGTDNRAAPLGDITSADPGQPFLEPVVSDTTPTSGTVAPTNTGNVTKHECSQLFDRYLELSIGSDDRLKDLPPEIMEQAKAQASQEKGDPCQKGQVPRAKYTCAMRAQSPKAWETCMK